MWRIGTLTGSKICRSIFIPVFILYLMVLQNRTDGLCVPSCCLHPIHPDPLCCVTTVHCMLFVVWSYYISTYSFSSLSVFCRLLWGHKRHVLAVSQCLSRVEFTALRCGRVNSVCTTGCLFCGCSFRGFVCFQQLNSPARQTGLSS